MVGCRGEIEGSGSILIDESQALPRSCHDGKVHLKQGQKEKTFFQWGAEENIAKGTTNQGVDCFDQ